jgi:hypothetical protein
MQVTVALKKVSVGTELDIEQAGVPDVIPPEACYLGWQQSLRNLARLVEPEINQYAHRVAYETLSALPAHARSGLGAFHVLVPFGAAMTAR